MRVSTRLNHLNIGGFDSSAYRRESGFALIAALGIMGFLVLLAVGLYSLSAVSLRVAEQASAQVKARANAKMALMISLGELQKTMGPDKRVSARAGIIAQDSRIGASVADGTPRALWVGVAGTDPDFGLDAETVVSAGNPAAKWLVSGLEPDADPADQLSQAFTKPVVMYGEQSIDLSTIGGPIEAGIVEVEANNSILGGGFAYFIDDDGLKAALAPADTELINSTTPSTASDLTPGFYDLSILDGMSALNGITASTYSKLFSTDDFDLIDSGSLLAASKRFSYTTQSLGVLSDVKSGGLKRDLTIAFEDEITFNEVFPRGTGDYTADYLCMDADKLAQSPELEQNGYIHWEVFKDYYNTKKHIKTLDGTKYLDPVRYSKAGPLMKNNGTPNPGWQVNPNVSEGSLFMAGRLGPHDIGDDETAKYPEMQGMPYGNYEVEPNNPRTPKNHEELKHSPIIPVLQRFQANAWMEQINSSTLRTHAQVWSSHYNPYNIALYVAGHSGGPRMLGTPEITAFSNDLNGLRFRYLHENQNVTGTREEVAWLRNLGFTSNKYQFHAQDPVMLLPGRSHVLAFGSDAGLGIDRTSDGLLYSDNVKNLTVQNVYRDLTYVTRDPSTNEWTAPSDLPASYDMEIRMRLMFTSLHHGVDDNKGGPGNFEVHQSFWAPFAWDDVGGRPGKTYDLGTVSSTTLNDNLMARLGFNLRTTKESGSTIRPLVDANIRCLFGNTRWDSPLGVSLLAAYSPEDDGEMNDMIMEMDVSDDPKGYTFWGADRGNFIPNSFSRVLLFDIPRSDLISLGQLQHAGAGRFSYEPTYIVGNSYANLRIVDGSGNIDLTQWKASVDDSFSTAARGLEAFSVDDSFNLYDASYLVNEVLWDGYIFTTIPQVADNVASSFTEPAPDDSHFKNLADGSAKLPNARYLPYAPEGSTFDRATLQAASNKDDATGAFYHNAGHLLVDGAFNVNSTSVDAWEAFLTSTYGLPVEKLNTEGEIDDFEIPVDAVRFPRVQHVFGEGVKKSALDENFWIGFRELEQSEVRALAVEIVEEIKKRGPFLSLADFVNRKLEDSELGESGALQAALDRTVNASIDSDYVTDEQGAGFPGQLLQGDILQSLAPYMNVRSDTFTIRAYGECTIGNSGGEVLARAWCEAKVQRYPDPLDSDASSASKLEELANPSSPFGRKFKIVSFRWLDPSEV